MLLIPQGMIPKITECSYLAAVLSDHNALKMFWELDTTYQPSYNWRFKIYMLKDPVFMEFMNGHINLLLETNSNSSSHSNIWEALKAYMRGQVLSYVTQKIREKRKVLTSLEVEIRNLEREYAYTKN